jgi:hypothetical protein
LRKGPTDNSCQCAQNCKTDHPAWQKGSTITSQLEDFMEYFLLEHPPDRLILCNRSGCNGIADYLEVSEQGGEDFLCAVHTSSEKHALVLPKGVPRGATPHGRRPAA